MQKGFAVLILVVGIAVMMGVVGFLLLRGFTPKSDFLTKIYPPLATPSSTTEPTPQSQADLTASGETLDETDMTQFDLELNQLDSDITGF